MKHIYWSRIHTNVDIGMGIQNLYEIEGVISIRNLCFHLLNRSIPFFPKTELLLKPGEQRFMKMYVPPLVEISGLSIIKLLDLKTGCTNTIKVQFIRNTGLLYVTNNSSKTLIFRKDEAMGIVYEIYWII